MVAIAACGPATPASADRLRQTTLLTLTDGTLAPQPYQGWVNRAKVPTPLPGVTLSLSSCGEAVACADPDQHRISVGPGRRWDMRVELLHELGHIFDAGMRDSARSRFTEIMRLEPLAWAEEPAGTGSWKDGSPQEQFAQGYALCALAGPRDPDNVPEWDFVYGYEPSRRQHRAVCRLIARVGR